MASQTNAMFAVLSYVLWAASATFHGIEISNFANRVELMNDMNKKIVVEV